MLLAAKVNSSHVGIPSKSRGIQTILRGFRLLARWLVSVPSSKTAYYNLQPAGALQQPALSLGVEDRRRGIGFIVVVITSARCCKRVSSCSRRSASESCKPLIASHPRGKTGGYPRTEKLGSFQQVLKQGIFCILVGSVTNRPLEQARLKGHCFGTSTKRKRTEEASCAGLQQAAQDERHMLARASSKDPFDRSMNE